MRSRGFVALMVAVSCWLLTACGGGGGSGGSAGVDGSTGGSTSGPANGSPTGLLPAAPTPGATLYADATTLLPLKAGATWHYRGVAPDGSGPPYGVLVRQSVDGADIRATRVSSSADDDQSLTYSVSGSTINATDPEAFGPGSPLTYTVLRSPVRQGEQITIADRTQVPTGTDIGGDKTADAADVLIDSRVVGNETVDLPDLQQSITALRVDTTAVLRFHPSGGGPVPPLTTTVQSEWDAAGIGIVRSASTAPASGLVCATFESDERLVFFDGVGRGLGALPGVRVRDSISGFPLGALRSAARAGDRVLVATDILNDFARTGMVLSALDANGIHQVSRTSTEVAPGEATPLLPIPDGVALINAQALPPTPFVLHEIRLRRFDRDAAPVGDPAGVVLVGNLLLGNAAAGSDGSKLWLLWSDASSNNGGTERLWLQDFDTSGRAIGAPRLLDSVDYVASPTRQFRNLALAATPGRVIATWGRWPTGALVPTAKVALATDTGAPVVRALGEPQRSPALMALPLATPAGQALFWSVQPGFSGVLGPDDGLLRGVAVAGDATLLRSAAPSLDAELLAARTSQVNAAGPSPGASDLENAIVFADGGWLQAAKVRQTVLLPGVDPAASSVLELLGWTPDGALASTAPSVRRLRLGYVGFADMTPLTGARRVVPLDDRLLVLDDGGPLTAAVVYRP
ncbi:MAG TPA: hypothetical protein PK306_13615 [Aquabacterium sp.]|nr:hypothetical protein [Aquabacterium sp.]